MTVPILVLAGGASTRMGPRDKLLEVVSGQPLLRLQAWRALKASRDVTVLIRPGRPDLKRALAGLPLRILQAPEAFEGMGGSIRAATRANLRNRFFLMVLADLVEIEAQDMRAVIAAGSTDEQGTIVWRGATDNGEPGHPILFSHAVYGELLNLRGEDGGRRLMQKLDKKVRLVTLPGQRARRDLDTPEDWDRWRTEQNDLSDPAP